MPGRKRGLPSRLARGTAHAAIRAYQLTLSGVAGRQCRFLPTCSDYMDQAIARHGVWPGAWMGASRICRCQPWGDSGYDPVPPMGTGAIWFAPWRYGRWRAQDRARSSAARP